MRTVMMVPEDRLAAKVRSRLGEERGFEAAAAFASLPGVEGIAAALDSADPDALFVEVTEAAAALVRTTRVACPESAIVACAAALSRVEAVEWLRTGASNCSHLGMSASDTRELVARLRKSGVEAAPTEPQQRRGWVAGFLSLKPGSGASTLAAQAAVALRRQGAGEVLLIDLNLASGTTWRWAEDAGDQADVLAALERPADFEARAAWERRTLAWNGVRVLAAPSQPVTEGLPDWAQNARALLDLARRHFD